MTLHAKLTSPKQPKLSLSAMALTLCLIIMNIAVYFYQLYYAAPLASQENNLLLFGANIYQLSLTGDWWRYPVSMVLHSGGFHLALNSLALFVIGIECEREYGKLRMLAIYLYSGIGASFISAYWQYHEAMQLTPLNLWESNTTVYITVSVGASGAIMGLAAASVIYLLKAINDKNLDLSYRDKLKRPLYNIIAMIALTLVNGLQSGIDNAAHIGGAVLGAAVSFAFVFTPQATRFSKNISSLCVIIIVASLLTLTLSQYSTLQDSHLNNERIFIYHEIEKELKQANNF